MSRLSGCGAIVVAMFFIAGACSSKDGTGKPCPILRVDYVDCPQSRNDARLPDVRDADASDAD
jgi:hypothetical protein